MVYASVRVHVYAQVDGCMYMYDVCVFACVCLCSLMSACNTHTHTLPPQRLETDVGDDYLNAEWADPTSLKKQFTGAGNISWRPK